MRKSLILATIFVLALSACQVPVPTATPPEPTITPAPLPTPTEETTLKPPELFDVDWHDRAIFSAGLIAEAQDALDELPGATVYHIDVRVPDDFFLIEGRQEVLYTNREDVPLNEIYFRLFPNAAGGEVLISNVKVNGQSVDVPQELQPAVGIDSGYQYPNAVAVPLPAALPPGEQVVIELDFAVEVPREMGGNYGLFGYLNGILALDEFYPVIPVYDDEGWNAESPPPNADVTYLDASFYLVRVTIPKTMTVVASGVEIDRAEEDKDRILTFAAGPMRDFYIAASNKYTVTSETVGDTTVNSYAFAEYEESNKLALQYAVDALESFSARFGIYPYTELDVVSAPMMALGMEYPGVVASSLNLYDLDNEISGLPAQVLLESTTAHEVGHEWFYNVVGNDQVDEPWVDEAIVQYLTGLYYLDTYGENAHRQYRASWEQRWDRVDRADIPIGLPAGVYRDRQYGAIVYGRGPLFIEALAEEMGQGKFDEFFRAYYQTNKWGISTGAGFKKLAEQYCECDLTPMFEEWVYEK